MDSLGAVPLITQREWADRIVAPFPHVEREGWPQDNSLGFVEASDPWKWRAAPGRIPGTDDFLCAIEIDADWSDPYRHVALDAFSEIDTLSVAWNQLVIALFVCDEHAVNILENDRRDGKRVYKLKYVIGRTRNYWMNRQTVKIDYRSDKPKRGKRRDFHKLDFNDIVYRGDRGTKCLLGPAPIRRLSRGDLCWLLRECERTPKPQFMLK